MTIWNFNNILKIMIFFTNDKMNTKLENAHIVDRKILITTYIYNFGNNFI